MIVRSLRDPKVKATGNKSDPCICCCFVSIVVFRLAVLQNHLDVGSMWMFSQDPKGKWRNHVGVGASGSWAGSLHLMCISALLSFLQHQFKLAVDFQQISRYLTRWVILGAFLSPNPHICSVVQEVVTHADRSLNLQGKCTSSWP